jgi:hypothetical protein
MSRFGFAVTFMICALAAVFAGVGVHYLGTNDYTGASLGFGASLLTTLALLTILASEIIDAIKERHSRS